jgi:hypothetical protein
VLDAPVCSELNTSAIRIPAQPAFWFDLKRDLALGVKVLKQDLEVYMKIAGQFVSPTKLESKIVGTRFR